MANTKVTGNVKIASVEIKRIGKELVPVEKIFNKLESAKLYATENNKGIIYIKGKTFLV